MGEWPRKSEKSMKTKIRLRLAKLTEPSQVVAVTWVIYADGVRY